MYRARVIVPAIVAALLIVAPWVSARPVQIWLLQELTDKADLVIVGTVSSTADAKNHVYPNATNHTWVAVDTVFDVSSVLKGELKANTLAVRHDRYHMRGAEFSVPDGPSFIEFNPRLQNRYLMFLKRTEDGLYEPLTGQYDPGDSFFLLEDFQAKNENDDPRATAAKSHASLKAYPNAVITLRDPKTENLFYVESNGRRLVALTQDGSMLWSVDLLDATNVTPEIGHPAIRHLELEEGRLIVTFGKHDHAEVQTDNGTTKYLGSN